MDKVFCDNPRPLVNPFATGGLSMRKRPLALLIPLLLPATAVIAAEANVGDAKSVSPKNIEVVLVEGKYIVNDKVDTATGLGLTLKETPQSVSIITDQQIIDLGLSSLTDVVNSAAGVSSRAYDSSRNAFSSRGFDINNYQIDGIPVHWDGSTSAGETQTDTALYERVEIVRGATGLLTGAGQPSASINLVRKHADSAVFRGDATVSVSRWDTYHASVDVGNALNDSGSIRGRAVVVYEDGNSYVDYAGNRKSVFYGVVDADLSDQTLLRLGASYQDNDPTASQWGGLPIFYQDGSRAHWDRSKTVGAKWTYWATTHKTYFANLQHQFNDDWEIRLNYNRTESGSDMKLLYLSGLPDRTSGLGMGAMPGRYDNLREQDDIGLRLTGKYSLFGREHELVVGATHSQQDFVYFQYPYENADPVGNFFEWDGNYAEPTWGSRNNYRKDRTKQTGYFVATRLSLTDELKLVAGSRIADWQRTDYFDDNNTYGDNGVVVPYVGVLYDLNEHYTLYASYTEIFQPQSNLDVDGHYLDPLKGINYEAGIKSQFLDDALHLTATVFRIKQKNFAVEDTSFEPTDEQMVAYRAAAGVTSEGFEIELVGDITDNWKISTNYTQFDATEQKDGRSVAVNTVFPNKLFRLFTTYNWQDLTVGGGINWEGKSYSDVFNEGSNNEQRVGQGAYALVNLMARYQLNDRLSVQLNIDNLFDKTYYSQIGFYTQLAYAEPRNATLSLKYQF
ncbi:TonB-dependent siderophore receptor [Shewanella sp. A3A]|nr:TonB-dependent siderophore receptor [Shewanella ferrihydritica]